jgi:hypothetical protein
LDFPSSQVSSIVHNVELEGSTCIELKGIVRPFEFRGALQTIFDMYSQKRISQNWFLNFLYIFPKSFTIFRQEQLDADILLSAYGRILYHIFRKETTVVSLGRALRNALHPSSFLGSI